ncbi:MAG: cyclodeaminase/cyclohydrolase family protein, partial [Desulfamplus sp.]|nr:cyclodeaminase/cyclohydrolase family protein [Desulfamplus sp.]
PLASMTLRGFIEELSARTSAPGGGSASAAMAAMGTGLAAMAAKLTYGVRKFEDVDAHMRRHVPILHGVTRKLISMIDADTSAFNEYMEALKMPRGTKEEMAARHAGMQAGLKTAINVPLETMRLGHSVWDSMCGVARYGNPATKSDIKVGTRALESGIWGAYQNVLINIEEVEDTDYRAKILEEAKTIALGSEKQFVRVMNILTEY